MKIAQKVVFTLLSLLAVPGLVYSDTDHSYFYTGDDFDDSTRGVASPAERAFAEASVLIHKLFDPIERGFTETRLFHMRDAVAQRVAKGESFNVAFMDELRKFLFREMKATVINIVNKKQLVDVDMNVCASALVQKLVVEGTKERYKIEDVFAQDPHTLPAFVFTYCTNRYVEPVLLRTGIPVQTRDAAMMNAWITSVYVGLGYLQQFCENGRTALELFGVQQLT